MNYGMVAESQLILGREIDALGDSAIEVSQSDANTVSAFYYSIRYPGAFVAPRRKPQVKRLGPAKEVRSPQWEVGGDCVSKLIRFFQLILSIGGLLG